MTPNQLLTAVKSRFVTLFHNDTTALNGLLRQSMGAYQDKAGVVKKITIGHGQLTVSIPENFDGLIACGNKNGTRVTVSVSEDGKSFDLSSVRSSDYPLTLSYFVDLRGVDLDAYPLPSEAVGLISDHLELLIQIPNSAREIRVAAAGGLDASHIPNESELRARIANIELDMESQLVLPTVSVR